jgi:hypothetical protein
MKFISYTAICIGFIVAAAAEGFCIGLLLSLAIAESVFHGEAPIGEGMVVFIVTVPCTLLSALFQYPFLWNKVRPALTN